MAPLKHKVKRYKVLYGLNDRERDTLHPVLSVPLNYRITLLLSNTEHRPTVFHVVWTSEIPVNFYQTTQSYNPENSHL
jgi:hypothetical protein